MRRVMNTNDAVLEAPAPGVCGLREFLIARVGDTHVAIAADRVETVSDAPRGAEPPCDEPWVAGWFVHRERMWLSVNLVGRDAPRAAGAKRILMRERDGARFAIEVDEIHGPAVLDEVFREPMKPAGWGAPDRWLGKARSFDGRPVCWVDVDAVAADLAR
jgi:chemotaxis signal transduction protein